VPDPALSPAMPGLSVDLPSQVPKRFSLQAATVRGRGEDALRRAALASGLDLPTGTGGADGEDCGTGGLVLNRTSVGPDSPAGFQL
jgi:hypothetical protein